MGRSPRFRVYAPRLCALFRLAFATATPNGLTSPRNVTRRPIMQKVRSHALQGPKAPAIALPLLVGTWFQVLLTPLAGVLFTFPSRYSFTIGRRVVFSLGGWCPQLPTRFHRPRGTRELLGRVALFRLQDCHLLWCDFPDTSATDYLCNSLERPLPPLRSPTTPHVKRQRAILTHGLGCSPFARHYLGNLG
jgi:hypothetical protein